MKTMQKHTKRRVILWFQDFWNWVYVAYLWWFRRCFWISFLLMLSSRNRWWIVGYRGRRVICHGRRRHLVVGREIEYSRWMWHISLVSLGTVEHIDINFRLGLEFAIWHGDIEVNILATLKIMFQFQRRIKKETLILVARYSI